MLFIRQYQVDMTLEHQAGTDKTSEHKRKDNFMMGGLGI
jgi:hypothetical protein